MLFYDFQWDGTELAVKTWYMIYRVLMAVLFTVIVIVFGVTTRDTLGLKFFIYMTNQGFMLLTLNYIFHASLVFIRWGWEINNKDKVCKCVSFLKKLNRLIRFPICFSDHQKCRINIFYKLSWILSTCSFDVALFITLVFWVALFPCEFHSFNVGSQFIKRIT